MQIDDNKPDRLSESMEALSARIARLAIGLGVNLDDDTEVSRLMTTPQIAPVSDERRLARPDGETVRTVISADRRVAHLHGELRGLLVLRYHMETLSINDNGVTATRALMTQAQEHLVSRGFKPGADGLDLDEFFRTT